MKQTKILTIIVGVFLIGIVIAGGTVINISEYLEIAPSSFIAGSTATANFSFDYPDISEIYPNQEDYAPLMIKVNITSEDQENYPVWKNDFYLSGSMINHGTWFSPDQEYNFNCHENDFTYYYNQKPYKMTNIPDGTFYCYNPGWLKMMRIDSRNDVTLNILSHPALYPGEYNITASLYYPQEEYINVKVTPIVSHIPYGKNTTVKFNMSFEISGGNAIRMKMSDLFEGYSPSEGISFTIENATNYTVEELNARLVYNETNYTIGNDYNYTQDAIIFPVYDGIARGSAIFMMDIKSYMKPGTYYGTYQFNVTKEGP